MCDIGPPRHTTASKLLLSSISRLCAKPTYAPLSLFFSLLAANLAFSDFMLFSMEEKEGKKAAAELVRIAKPKAPIFVSAMDMFTIFGGTVSTFQTDLDSRYIDK